MPSRRAKPVKDADDPHRTLRTENGVGRAEQVFVEVGRRVEVARNHRGLEAGAEVAPRVLQQRDQVVGRGACACILKVQQTDPRETAGTATRIAPFGQPHQVAGVKIAQAKHGRPLRRGFQRLSPRRLELGCHRGLNPIFDRSLKKERSIAHQPRGVVARQVGWHRLAVEINQKVGG